MFKKIGALIEKILFQPKYLYDTKRVLTEEEKEDWADRQW